MKEIDIKIKLVKWLMNSSQQDTLIGSEFRFDFGARRTDIIALSGDSAFAYEIKGAGDSLRTLEEQTFGYKQYFDYCYIVCEESNIRFVRLSIPKDVGILLINENDIIVIRKSRNFKKLNKLMLLSSIDMNSLRKIGDKTIRSKHDLCQSISLEKNLDFIKELSRSHLREKLKFPYMTFKKELGQEINYDDITTLERMPSFKLI